MTLKHTGGCLGMQRMHKCTNSNANIEINTRVHKNQQNFHMNFPYRSIPLPLFHHLFLCDHCISPLLPNVPPSVVFFLQGLCFPLPAVMLISAVIRREGLNAAFLTIPLRQTHRAELSRTERERERRAHAF